MHQLLGMNVPHSKYGGRKGAQLTAMLQKFGTSRWLRKTGKQHGYWYIYIEHVKVLSTSNCLIYQCEH